MNKYPLTAEEAQARIYGRVDRLQRGTPYNPAQCAYEVSVPPWYFESHQCARKPGHGHNGLFCKQHAKLVAERNTIAPWEGD